MRVLGLWLAVTMAAAACGDDGNHKLGNLQVSDFSVTTAEDTALAVTIPVQDDAGRTISVTIDAQPAHGTLTASADATMWTYTPAANFNGSDAVAITVSDGASTADAKIAITVTPVDDAPVAGADALTVAAGSPTTIHAAQLLANDTDVEGDTLAISAVGGAQHATVALSGTDITFTPEAQFSGAASFTYTLDDGHGATATGTVAVTVTSDAAPVANADTASTAEDTVLTIATTTLLANDTDSDGSAAGLSITAVTAGTGGSVSLSGATVTFTPDANFNGDAAFTYTVSDGTLTATGTVTVSVTAVNDPPVAVDDVGTTAEDTALVIPGAALTANDTDVEGDALTVTGASNAQHGTVAFAGGSVTFTPAATFVGAASFDYTVDDGHGGTDTGTVAVTVTSVNHAPTAVNDSLTVAEDTAGTINVVTNDTDPDGDTLTVTAHGNATKGAVAFTGNVATYTPNANANGSDSFTYTINDGHGGTASGTVAVTITPVNDPPTAVADALTTAEDTTGTVNVLANDTDVDGDTVTVSGHTNGAHGSVTFSGGTASYTPAANFNGTDSFTYTLSDGKGGTATGTVNVTVTPVNDAPTAGSDGLTTAEDTTLVVSGATLVANDSDPDGDTLTVTAVTGGAATHGTVSLSGGQVTYVPAANFNGGASFNYTVSDGHGGTATGLVSINVTPVDDPPTAGNDAFSTNEDTTLAPAAPGVLANDSDVDGDAVTAVIATQPSHASSFTLNANGSFTYVPVKDFNGTDSFSYKAVAGVGTSAAATVTITVTPVNDAPVGVADAFSTNEDTVLNVTAPGVLGNDTDVDGDSLKAVLDTGPTHGTVAMAANGSFKYTPNGNFNGTDSFLYRANDGTVNSAQITVTITVNPVNDGPLVTDDFVTTAEDAIDTIPFSVPLANDSDPDGDTLTITATGLGAHGSVVLSAANSTITYTPTLNFNGADSFTYTVSDGHGGTATAKINVTVTAVDDAPVAKDDPTLATPQDTTATFDVVANDTDVENDTLTPVIQTGPAHGTASVVNRQVRYVPNEGFIGTDTFTYKASDGTLTSNTATATINVTRVNHAPVASDTSTELNQDTSTSGQLSATDPDAGDTLTFSLASPAGNGTATVASDGTFTYTPDGGFTGNDSFTFIATDNHGLASNEATVSIQVDPFTQDPRCGDNKVNGTEECDDGNLISGDGCESNCTFTCASGQGASNVAVDRATGACYAGLPSQGLNYDQAAQTCVSLGGHLASVTSAREATIVQAATPSGIQPWLGANARQTNTLAALHWITGEKFSFSQLPGNPTFPSGDACVRQTSSTTWTLDKCGSIVEGDVCEFDLLPAPRAFVQADASETTATGDLNGDGFPDVVTASSTQNEISIRHSDHAGGLSNAQVFAVGKSPVGVAVADLDGDGKLDIATVNSVDHTVTLLRTKGATSTFTSLSIAFGTNPVSIALCDVDKNGKLDVVATDATDNVVVLSKQNTDGTFGALSKSPVGKGPVAIACADINGDGFADVYTANKAEKSVSRLLGNANGFGAQTTTAVGGTPVAIVAADLDAKLPLDFATASSEDLISVGIASATGVAVSNIAAGPNTVPSSIAAGDVNLDGSIDLVVGNGADHSATVFLNTGTAGVFSSRPVLDLGQAVTAVSLADLDGDGVLDLVTAQPADKAVDVVLGPGGVNVEPHVARDFGTGTGGGAIATADFDGDGTLDTVLLQPGQTFVQPFLNTLADGLPTQAVPFTAPFTPVAVAAGKLDAGNNADIVLVGNGATGGSRVQTFIHNVNGGFTPSTSLALAGVPSAVVLGDFDKDGDLDVAVLEPAAKKVEVFANDGTGKIALATSLVTGAGAVAIVSADWNNDALADLAVTNQTDNSVSVFLAKGALGFTTLATFTVTSAGFAAVADFNRDGKPDLVVIDAGKGNAIPCLGKGDGTFAVKAPVVVGTSPSSVAAGDLDADGNADIAVTNAGDAISYLLGNGDGTFNARVPVEVGNTPTSCVIGDLDGDGEADLEVSSLFRVDVLRTRR